MITNKLLLCVFTFLLLIGCAKEKKPIPYKAETEEFSRISVETEIRAMFDDYFSAIKEGGLSAEFDYLDDSEDFFWVPPGYQSALSYDSVKNVLTANGPQFQSIEFEWKSLRVIPLSATLGTYTGIVSGIMTDTAGVTIKVALIESGTIIKRQDGWKLLSGQSRNLLADN